MSKATQNFNNHMNQFKINGGMGEVNLISGQKTLKFTAEQHDTTIYNLRFDLTGHIEFSLGPNLPILQFDMQTDEAMLTIGDVVVLTDM